MPTKTKPIRAAGGERFPALSLDAQTKQSIAESLGIAEVDATTAFRQIEVALSEGLGRIRWAQTVPLPAHLRAELEPLIAAVQKALAQIEGLSSYAKAVLRGTRGEGNSAEVDFLVASRALQERAVAVRAELNRKENADRARSSRSGSPSDGGARKHKVYKEKNLERSEAAKLMIAMAKQQGLAKPDGGDSAWTPMRTTLIAIYQQYAKKPTKLGLAKFLKLTCSGLNQRG